MIFFYDFKKGLSRQDLFCETFSKEAPLEKTILNWFAEFRHNCAYVSDESHEEQLKLIDSKYGYYA